MNNEPIAWTDGKGNYFDKNSFFPVDDLIPLYTHPHPDNFGLALSIIDQQKLEIEKLKAKTLTDEEIKELSEKHLDMDWQTGVIEFARAILRKAQEK